MDPLRHLPVRQLAAILDRHRERHPAPHLLDPARARRLAKRNGVWQRLTDSFDANRPIPVIRRSAYRNFQRHGDRQVPQAASMARWAELEAAILALWLRHPKADVDYLQDLMWAICDSHTWVMAAHEGCHIDLGSSRVGVTLAEALSLLDDQLEDEVMTRVDAAIRTHVLAPYSDPLRHDWWRQSHNNWNHVCNANIIRTALYRVTCPTHQARLIHGAIRDMAYGIDGFADDGGCLEGPGYWAYGFGHYLQAAYALWERTAGEIDLVHAPKIEKICRFPLAADIAAPLRTRFADAHHGYLAAHPVLLVNRWFDVPELYALCQRDAAGRLTVGTLHELGLYDGRARKVRRPAADAHLPSMGLAKLRSAAGPRQLTLAVLAGSNDVPHNHNDIGSYMIHRGDRIWLDDPGGPTYSQKTFSARRYESIYCNSLGHSVPLINGRQQQTGSAHRGDLAIEQAADGKWKAVCIDMTRAYPAGTVTSLLRRFELDVTTHCLTLVDRYVFKRKPRRLEECFITLERATLIEDDRAVQLGPKRGGLVLAAAADTPGMFAATPLVEESKEGKTGLITRITFTPATLARELQLTFTIG
jgi:hypothetical protein